MNVLKFGGTSVGTVSSLQAVKRIVEEREGPSVVVVSALGGLTDRLIATADAAAAGEDFTAAVAAFSRRHHDIIEALVPLERRRDVLAQVDARLDELADLYRGIARLGAVDPKTLDAVVAQGERMSSVIVAAIIEDAVRLDSLDFIKTTRRPDGRHLFNPDISNSLIARVFADCSAPVIVVPGFIARDAETGDLTNLGRGGSDYTAAIIAANLRADLLEIWTDVDGFMTADPRMIPNAMVLDQMSMVEAMELCNYGAKVIYPPTIYPVFHAGIPIVIKNTFNTDAPGTFITDSDSVADADLPVKGVTAIKDTAMVVVEGVEPALSARIFNAMGRGGIDLFMTAQLAGGMAFIIKGSHAEAAHRILSDEFAIERSTGSISSVEVIPNLATIAVVGRNIRHIDRLSDKLLEALAAGGFAPLRGAIAMSETGWSTVVPSDSLQPAMQILHDTLFVPKPARPRVNPALIR